MESKSEIKKLIQKAVFNDTRKSNDYKKFSSRKSDYSDSYIVPTDGENAENLEYCEPIYFATDDFYVAPICLIGPKLSFAPSSENYDST